MRTDRRGAAGALLVPLLLLVTACGVQASVGKKPDKLDGDTLATRANTQQEKQNPKMVHGELTCPDVKYEVGATSRCMRTVVLDDGRLVRIGATVTIDKVTSGGHFKVQVDDGADEFGVTGKAILADLAKQYASKYGGTAPTGSCPPYLAGRVGTKMTCSLDTPDGKLGIEVTVTKVDPKNFATIYRFRALG